MYSLGNSKLENLMILQIILIVILSIICGILGRLGGRAKDGSWYDCISHTKTRDLGCALIDFLALWALFGLNLNLWWLYLIIFLLHFGALTTYYDILFKYDNLWFSGFIMGVALIPYAFFGVSWINILCRALLLGIVWGCLNKYLPTKILIWNRDIVEEFLRYFSIILTLLIIK